MPKLVPHLWYDKEAKEAAMFYTSLFDRSKLLNVGLIQNTPSGDVEIVSFELAGQQFEAISAGPFFQFNPSCSLMVACDSVEEVNIKWQALLEGGLALMPLDAYPFSKWYGWVQDRYGLSWQLMLVEEQLKSPQKITPNLLFSDRVCGKAEEAVTYYTKIFNDAEGAMISRYQEGEAINTKAKVNFASFRIEGMQLSAMDNGYDVDYSFNEAFSIMVKCRDQREIDYYWNALSAVPEAEQCGWVKDKFGVSWQIVPEFMDEILFYGSREEVQNVTEAFLKMKKFDIAALEKAKIG
ncbi:VOC family protein [Dendrosporobacter sp. 1207_IL3150]|uniref:VOC family protein n=1 Tax=Dendrosporobacter sp. 1207_IL3150 TaxID=3084054 RepID=UPI002FDAC2B6